MNSVAAFTCRSRRFPQTTGSNLVIGRLDKFSLTEDVQAKLTAPDCGWDLIVCDETHKMSATCFVGRSGTPRDVLRLAPLDEEWCTWTDERQGSDEWTFVNPSANDVPKRRINLDSLSP